MAETITATLTLASETITVEMDTAARGPVGPAGTNGTNGSDASVTAANVQAALAAAPEAARDAMNGFWFHNVMDYGAVGDGVADDTTAIQDALDAAAISTANRTVFLPPGNYLVTAALEIPVMVSLVGCGTELDATLPYANMVTRITLDHATANVIEIPFVSGQEVGGFHLDGGGTTGQGIDIGNGSAYAGNSIDLRRIRIHDCGGTGVRARFLIGLSARHVHANYCGWGWEFGAADAPVDTSKLEFCGAFGYTTGGFKYVSGRNITFENCDMGHGTGPAFVASGGYSCVVFDNCNIEGVATTHVLEVTYQQVEIRNCKIDVLSESPSLTSFIRQTVGDANIIITNPRLWIGGTPGYMWEGVDGMRPPVIVGQGFDSSVFRFSPSNAFATTTKTVTWGAWKNPGAKAYRTSNQTIATGTPTVVIWTTEVTDSGGNFSTSTGLLTAPVAGWYQLNASVFLNDANPNYTRLFERHNGTDGRQLDILPNHPAFAMLRGSDSRYLAIGDTWGVSVSHDKGSNLAIYATGGGQDGGITITKTSD